MISVVCITGLAASLHLATDRPTLLAQVQQPTAQQEETTGDRIPETPTGSADSKPAEIRESVRRIPNQKVHQGAPDTVISLDQLFTGTETAEAGGPLTISIDRVQKEKVVKASIEGDRLRLSWGKVGKSEVVLKVVNQRADSTLSCKFQVEVWEPDWTKLAFTVFGGLGIFLLGMKNMSEGLQAIAGNGLRRMISLVTDNRFLAVGVGTLVTMLVQSSSITTVMVIGFVNSGFMTLSQAVGVIMGANIGTTITGWILVLKIGKYGLAIAGLGSFGYLFGKGDRLRYAAMSIMGLGLIFFGLELMKDGFGSIKDLPAFEEWFHRFNGDSYLGVLKCATVGCILTFIVQSSSATLGITIGLAQMGVIDFHTAAALVLGENVGTTITAWLASFGATTNARRAAYFHVVFNMLGVFWITALFQVYVMLIQKIVAGEFSAQITDPGQVTAAIAATHTGFNVANTVLFVPFAGYFATFLKKVIPDTGIKERPHLTNLDIRVLETPVIAIEQSRVEVLRMAHGCDKMAGWLKSILESEQPDNKLVQKSFHREEVLDTIQDEIVEFMTNLLSGNVPHRIIGEGRSQLRIADEYESVSDYLIMILKSHLKLHQAGLRFSKNDRQTLLELHELVSEYLKLISEAYERRQPDVITKAHSQGEAITHRVKELRDQFVARMSEERVEPQVSVAYNAQLNAFRRVRDHALNVAEAIAGEK